MCLWVARSRSCSPQTLLRLLLIILISNGLEILLSIQLKSGGGFSFAAHLIIPTSLRYNSIFDILVVEFASNLFSFVYQYSKCYAIGLLWHNTTFKLLMICHNQYYLGESVVYSSIRLAISRDNDINKAAVNQYDTDARSTFTHCNGRDWDSRWTRHSK